MKLLIDISEEMYKWIYDVNKFSNDYGMGDFIDLIENGTPIPNNATNGDVIKAMFPYGKYNEYFADVEMDTGENHTRFEGIFDRDWWDEIYKKRGKE